METRSSLHTGIPSSALRTVDLIANGVVHANAASVDRESRFPHESIAALRDAGMLAAGLPREYGGLGCSVVETAGMCTRLARSCASTGMIFAMHQVQLACLARHATAQEYFQTYLKDAAQKQWLIANAISEVGVGMEVSRSDAMLRRDRGRFAFRKCCSAASYVREADAIIVVIRDGDAPDGVTIAVLVKKEDCQLESIGTWDALGMRGTCTPSVCLVAAGDEQQLLHAVYREVASQTTIPLSHILWSACWLGIAEEALSVATAYFRHRTNSKGASSIAELLAEIVNDFQTMNTLVQEGAREYDELISCEEGVTRLSSSEYILRINNLKVTSSELVRKICIASLQMCGFLGYSNNSEFSVTRNVRDALSAAVMVPNQRILAVNARLHLGEKA